MSEHPKTSRETLIETMAQWQYEREHAGEIGERVDGGIVPAWGDPFYDETWAARRANVEPWLDALLAAPELVPLLVSEGVLEECDAMETFIAGDGQPAIRSTPGPLFRRVSLLGEQARERNADE